MPSVTVGVFTIDYTLFTNASPGNAIQFGMDFTLTNTGKMPLSQLIFPAVAVGRNQPGRWNLDNHNPGNDPASLVFSNAMGGVISDGPREIVGADQGIKSTKFGVFIVDVSSARVQSQGVQFGYSINTSDQAPATVFAGLTAQTITNEQKALMQAKCSYIKFV